MIGLLKTFIYLIIIAVAVASGICHWKRQRKDMHIIVIFLIFSLLSELTATYLSLNHTNNLAIYHIYTPISLWIIAYYFQESIMPFKTYRVGHLIGLTGALMAILNIYFFQNSTEFNSNSILFSGLCIIGMCLYSFLYIIKNEERKLTQIRLFWVSLILLIFWCSTYLIFALIDILVLLAEPESLKVVYTMLWIVNLLQYAGLAIVFFIPQPKIKTIDG